MPICAECGKQCRGYVHTGHCHDVYYGRLLTARRPRLRDVREVAQALAMVHEYMAARRHAIETVNQSIREAVC